MARDLDIILFGATGFTGKHAIPFIFKFAAIRQLTWGIAGRSEGKLKELLSQREAKIGGSLSHIPIVIANSDDENSLKAMARRARIIINCCGPYQFLGEPVVKACVEEGTHHVDVSGEPQYMENMQLKYHDQAREKGVYIISACGIDSIPSDLGVVFLDKKFGGTLNSAEAYLKIWEEGHANAGPVLNFSTWESAIYVLAFAKELRKIRTQLYPKLLPSYKPKVGFKFYPHKSDAVKGWIFPNLGSDRSVVRRSQYYFYENDSKRPIQIHTYFAFESFFAIIKIAIMGLFLAVLSRFGLGRSLLLNYPELFSGGYFSRKPPSEERIEKARFSVTLHGKGWKDTDQQKSHELTASPNKELNVRVSGRNPGYGATCICLVLSAITVITEPEKMPPGGGVYPPGYAFAKTSLIDQLNNNGVTFEVLKGKN